MECSRQGCIRPAYRVGLCTKHYKEQRLLLGPRCYELHCDQPVHANGLCNKHYRRELAGLKQECIVAGCGRPAQARGYCNSHYRRMLRHGTLDPTRPKDWGGKAAHPLYETWLALRRYRAEKPVCDRWLGEFWDFVADVGERPSPRHRLKRLDQGQGYGPANFEWQEIKTKPIAAASKAEYMRKWHQQYRDANPERYRRYEFKRRFGLDYEAYERLLAEQGGKCAICGQGERALNYRTGEPRQLAVDHCHDSNYIRGLLCSQCNTALGLFGDSVESLQKAIRYLKTHPPRLL